MIDINYYRKIQNAYGINSLCDVQRNSVKQDLNNDFHKTLDFYSVTIDNVSQDLTILETSDYYIKKIKSRPNEKFSMGQIVYWMNSYWLIKEVDSRNDIVTQGKMYECNFVLYWQDASGNILSRHVYNEDFTKYSNGETGNSNIIIGDNQYGVYLPIDEDTKKLKRGMRFAFDFDDTDKPDVYTLTNRKISLYDYTESNKSGVMLLVFSFNGFNSDTDKQITLDNGHTVWICDYKSPTITNKPSEPIVDTVNVSLLGRDILRCGMKRTWTLSVKDDDGNDIGNYDFTCTVSNSHIKVEIDGMSIQLFTDDKDLIDEDFTIQIIHNDEVVASAVITIVGGF